MAASYNTTSRSGLGMNYPVYGAFQCGMTAQVVWESADLQWCAVSVPVATTGQRWVSAFWTLVLNLANMVAG